MGYFSNGTEGSEYRARYCAKCVHGKDDEKGCAVYTAHLLKNYEECNNKDSILHMLIPVSEDGLSNEQCLMHMPLKGESDGD